MAYYIIYTIVLSAGIHMYICVFVNIIHYFLAPEYLLCLQGGRFDHPNRLFHGVAQTWNNVLLDHVDLKEVSMSVC